MKKLNGEEPSKLQAVSLRHIKPEAKTQTIAGGHSLSLVVMPSGAMYWRYKYRFGGKRKQLALDVFPAISLAEPRKQNRLAARSTYSAS